MKFLSLAAAALALAIATGAGADPTQAHSCSSRYTHAIVGGEHKCLGTGQICNRSYQATYRSHGFVCKTGSDGRLRLHRR